MKAYIVCPDGKCEFRNLPMPKYDAYSALVKMESCGICNGTDMKIIQHKLKGISYDKPIILGHEGVGRVIEKGENVQSFEIGDLVLQTSIGDVPEGYTSAWGSYAEYNIVSDAAAMKADGLIPDEFMYTQQKLPADIDPVSAAMIITFREVLSTMKIFGMEPNKSITILGLGPVGLSFVKFARLTGMGPIIALDIVEEKLKLAKEYGADYAFNSKEVDVEKAVRGICPDGVDFVLDAVGIPAFINTGLSIIKPSAKICVYGTNRINKVEIDWSRCDYNWTLQFNQSPSVPLEVEAHNQILNWMKLGVLDPADYVSHVFDFKDLNEAFAKIERREPMMKMVVKF